MSDDPSVHAGCIVVGEAGVLIRGPSGAGKSSLAAALIERAAGQCLFARLVADDRVRLAARNGRLVASAPKTIAGLIERRGVGIVPAAHLGEAVVRLVVDIEIAPERMPGPDERTVALQGVAAPRLAVARGDSEAPGLVLACLELERRRIACDSIALAFAARHGKMPPSAWDAPTVRSDRARVTRGGL